MSRSTLRLRGSLVAVLLVSLVWLGCADSRDLAAPDDLGPNIRIVDQVALDRAIRVQEAHTDQLMALEAVVGTGVGLTADGQPAVKIFTREAGVAGLPESLEGVPVAVEVTGMIFALRALADPTAKFAWPVPIGVSTGHPDITAGTIGARVKKGGDVFALSNNHVYAVQNSASIGDDVIQPGTFDGGALPDDFIGSLYDFEPIKFAKRRSAPPNTMDAAIALSSTLMLGNATPGDGYGTPSSTIASASPGQLVKKYGRTTGLTHGTVDAVNVTVNVCYEGFVVCTSWAKFEDQIAITDGTFSGGGDSGSLIVTDDANNNPVGLLFAGSSSHTIANQIDLVLSRFGVTIDGDGTPPPPPPPPPPGGGVSVSSIVPNSMLAGTSIGVIITGTGFADGADVTFENGSGPAPTASNVVVVDGETITATVTVKNGGRRGDRVWDVRVTNGDNSSGVLAGGFTVTK